jgi:post-segregation antitoxin (ccd killing protein)
MPKVSVYIPDDLYDAARKHGISISTVSQKALKQELRQHANTDWVERVRNRPPRVHARIDTSELLGDVRDEFGA